MFSIPHCRSIGLHVLLAIAFGITEFHFPGNSIPANETCANISGEIICYFRGSEKLLGWNNASQLCNSFESTLPVIRSKNDQDAVAGYLKSYENNEMVWTAGKKFTYSNWTWINGEPLQESVQENGDQAGTEDYAAFERDSGFIALAASNELPYICQFKDAYCDINVTDSCLRFISDNRTWYDARNQCLKIGGDLAIIDNDSQVFHKEFKLKQRYWIGLRKKFWQWSRNYNEESNDEIKYTNWDINGFSRHGECISIGASDGKWKAIGCNELKTVVCQRAEALTSTMTTKMSDENIQTEVESFTTQALTSTMTTETSDENIQTEVEWFTSVSKESTTYGSQGSMPQSPLFGVVGAGIVIIICIIVIIVCALRTKKESVKEISQSKMNSSSPQNNREELDSRITNAPVYASMIGHANPPEQRSADIQGVYVDVSLSTLDQSEDGATSQQSGIVYASVAFNEDPTYLKPDKKPDHATAPTKIGPLGDNIYAMPDVQGHAATSPGNDSASPPVKVTPQGDTYALPVNTSNSPTANTPDEAIYTNLQTKILDKQQVTEEHDSK